MTDLPFVRYVLLAAQIPVTPRPRSREDEPCVQSVVELVAKMAARRAWYAAYMRQRRASHRQVVVD